MMSFLVDEFSKQRFHSVLIKTFLWKHMLAACCHDFPQSQKLSQKVIFSSLPADNEGKTRLWAN
jgi:hypothetical protein